MPEQLLHRSTASVDVDVIYTGEKNLILAVGVNGVSASTDVAPDRVLDAFHHPFVYLDDSQVARLLPKP